MRVRSILNNNAVVANMDDGSTAIVLGAGLGFNLRRGELIPGERVQEIYRARSSKNNALIRMLDSIEPLYLEVSTAIMETAVQRNHQEYSPFLIIELADHISLALKRMNEGIPPVNLLVDEMKALYPGEFAVARDALGFIQNRTGVALCEEEAGFIAMHLITARINRPDSSGDLTVNLTNEMLALVLKHFKLELKKEQALHARFLTHLKFLAARILQGQTMDTEKLTELYDALSDLKGQDAFVQDLKSHIQRKYNYTLCSDEIFYILIHLRVLMG